MGSQEANKKYSVWDSIQELAKENKCLLLLMDKQSDSPTSLELHLQSGQCTGVRSRKKLAWEVVGFDGWVNRVERIELESIWFCRVGEPWTADILAHFLGFGKLIDNHSQGGPGLSHWQVMLDAKFSEFDNTPCVDREALAGRMWHMGVELDHNVNFRGCSRGRDCSHLWLLTLCCFPSECPASAKAAVFLVSFKRGISIWLKYYPKYQS